MSAWHRVGALGVVLSVPLVWGCRCGSDARIADEDPWDGGSLGGRASGRGGEAGQEGGSGGAGATGGASATGGMGATGGAASGGSSPCVAAPPPSPESGNGGESGASSDSAEALLFQHFDGVGHQQFLAAAFDTVTFDMVLGGRNSGSVSFGGEALESSGTDDVIVVKLDQNGRHIWSREFSGTDDGNEIVALALGQDGSVYATGYVGGPIDFGTGLLESAPIGCAKSSCSPSMATAARAGRPVTAPDTAGPSP